jgi:ferredoxin
LSLSDEERCVGGDDREMPLLFHVIAGGEGQQEQEQDQEAGLVSLLLKLCKRTGQIDLFPTVLVAAPSSIDGAVAFRLLAHGKMVWCVVCGGCVQVCAYPENARGNSRRAPRLALNSPCLMWWRLFQW